MIAILDVREGVTRHYGVVVSLHGTRDEAESALATLLEQQLVPNPGAPRQADTASAIAACMWRVGEVADDAAVGERVRWSGLAQDDEVRS